MQRIVSGEDIHDLPEYNLDLDQDRKERTEIAASENIIKNSTTTMSQAVSVNFVENDGEDEHKNNDDDGMMMDVEEDAGSISESSIGGSQEANVASQQSSLSVSNAESDDNIHQANRALETDVVASQQPLQSPLSIISGLLPNVTLKPLSRLDSRNSGTMSSLGSGLPRSQNSSRDWGWFEDVHHSDQSVPGRTGGDTRKPGSQANKTSKTSVASPERRKQQSQMSTGVGMRVQIGEINTDNKTSDRSKSGSANSGILGGNEGKSNRSSTDRGAQNDSRTTGRGFRSGSAKRSNAVSLLPRGDEMLIDDMQEFLEPLILHNRTRDMENEASIQAVTAPNYVLEESLSDQLLWKKTAGNRPPQPVEERAFFEAQWAANFANSEVKYEMPTEVLTASTPVSLNPFAESNFGNGIIGAGTPSSAGGDGNNQDVADMVSSFVVPGGMGIGGNGMSTSQQNPHLQNQPTPRVIRDSSGNGGNLTVYYKGDNVFGTTVSKSFPKPSVNGELVSGVDTVNISVASYRVVESENSNCGKHAQFLVIYREGSIRDTTGVWKRYSDFQELSKKVTKVHEGCASVIANMSPLAMTEEHDVEHLPNAITSWHLLKKRKRWYRCLDSGYLSLKAFLLERFLHDILFESSTPDLLRDFVGVADMI